jgi:FixJ family two-component response regulator
MQKKPVVAIVDDDESACEGTMDLLKAMGFIAKGSRSAEDFLQSSHLRDTACVVTDMRMSGMTGLELHDHLAQSGSTIPTILVTAFPNDRDRTRAVKAGVVCYLAKPFNDQDLLRCVRSALESRRVGNL